MYRLFNNDSVDKYRNHLLKGICIIDVVLYEIVSLEEMLKCSFHHHLYDRYAYRSDHTFLDTLLDKLDCIIPAALNPCLYLLVDLRISVS